MPAPPINLLLDSGAYSAWTHNETIDVREYIKFVKQVKDKVWAYVNLDVIPGTIETVRTREMVEASAKSSYENLQRMKDAGLRPLPVFHQGESFKWFEKMVADGEEYIGVSTAKNQPNKVQEKWLDDFFTAITDKQGRPLVKIHGFGSSHANLLMRLPWYSCDSAGWVIAAAYGKIYVPQYVDGKPDYLRHPLLMSVTGNMMTSKASQALQFANYGPLQQEAAIHFLEEEVGCGLGMARHDLASRWLALVVYYLKVSERIDQIRFKHHRSNLVSDIKGLSAKPVKIKGLHYVFATAYDNKQYRTLMKAGAKNHLLSYYELKNRPEAVAQYINGEIKTRPGVRIKKDDQHFGNRRYRDFRARNLIELARETVEVPDA